MALDRAVEAYTPYLSAVVWNAMGASASAEDVEEVAVFGVENEMWGEVPFACVVLQKQSRLTPDEIRAYLRDHLAHYKTPKQIEIVQSLPKNAVGKVVKSELQKIYKLKER